MGSTEKALKQTGGWHGGTLELGTIYYILLPYNIPYTVYYTITITTKIHTALFIPDPGGQTHRGTDVRV